ncbi:MAG: methyltransferase [Actinomycetaceae bacterium]|nr:methyltransferase [Actinomycetaceae bacterium]
MSDHYFSSQPSSSDERIQRGIEIRGLPFYVTLSSGVFSHTGLDLGTRVLCDKAPTPPSEGVFVDLGCGWGPLTLTLASCSPQARVYGVDVNERAIELTKLNAQHAGLENVVVGSPQEVLEELGDTPIDLLWSNPPVRIGKDALHDLLSTWLSRLSPEGAAYLVVSKNLGADSLTKWLNSQGWSTQKIASAKGFRILCCTVKTDQAS